MSIHDLSEELKDMYFLKNKAEGFRNRLFNKGIKQPSIETGIKPVDMVLDGCLRQGMLVLIASESGIGTDVLMNNMADNISKTKPVVYISLNNGKRHLHEKSIVRISNEIARQNQSEMTGIRAKDLEHMDEINEKKLKAIESAVNEYCSRYKIAVDPFTKDPVTNSTKCINKVDYIDFMTKTLTEEAEPPVIFIDGSYMLRTDDVPTGMTMKEAIFEELRNICNEYGATIIVSVPISKESAKYMKDNPNETLYKECIKDATELTYLADMILHLKRTSGSNGYSSSLTLSVLKDETLRNVRDKDMRLDMTTYQFRV